MLNIISLGAGVQSSTMALMAAHGEITPMPDCAIFADVGDEPDSVYEWLDWLETRLPFPVRRVQKGVLSDDALTMRVNQTTGSPYTKLMIPHFTKDDRGIVGMSHRQCTTDYKIDPIIKELRSIANIKRGEKETQVIQWIGISKDEAQRMKPARNEWIENRWPLIERDMTRLHCIEWMAEKGYPEPPRSACVFCPYKSDEEWVRLKNTDPQGWIKAIRFEKDAQELQKQQSATRAAPYLHRSAVPLEEVDFRMQENQINMFNNECEGMCGV